MKDLSLIITFAIIIVFSHATPTLVTRTQPQMNLSFMLNQTQQQVNLFYILLSLFYFEILIQNNSKYIYMFGLDLEENLVKSRSLTVILSILQSINSVLYSQKKL
jgi:hypothetical protein